ncbi:hypothetical protein FA95DRAFT_1505989, partial [Auriscalpium vulgare]
MERNSPNDPILIEKGPILDKACSRICKPCLDILQKGKIPSQALANGNWIGQVPPQLQGLSFTEKMLIARVCRNGCVIKVQASGQYKMVANAVMYGMPMPRIYSVLPPRADELDDVMAFVYIGPTRPTTREHRRTPFLV